MANYKLVLSYDGSRYKGWQKLGNQGLTIQKIVEDAIKEVLDYQVEIYGSGRTDAGVHARRQVANMKVPFLLKETFHDEVNTKLPEDIHLVEVIRVPGEFHARYSASGKEYRYYVDLQEKPNVFTRKFTYHFPEELNLDAMKEAASYLTGVHDFSAFTDDKTERDKVRNIYDIQVIEKQGVLEIIYRGDGFLQHMVRIMTGTLLDVGVGKMMAKDITDILESRERAKAGFMAPSKGLFLEKVDYK